MTAGDLDDMASLLGDPVVMQFYPATKTWDEAAAWIAWNQKNYESYGFGLWIIETHSSEFVGDCGPTWQQVNGEPRLEVGYHVRPSFQGQGLATEAAAACRDFARAEVRASELVAIIHPGNEASGQVARIGMERLDDDRRSDTTVRTVLGMPL